MASIYLISRQSGVIKVGISANVRGRLSTLRTASHEPLMLAFDAHVGDGAAALERAVHEGLDARRLSGEWFKVTPDAAIAAITEAAGRLALPCEPKPISRGRKRRIQIVQFVTRVTADFAKDFRAAAKKYGRTLAEMLELSLGCSSHRN
jgi:hypothetical protein